MEDLIKRLEAAEVGSRGLDREIVTYLGFVDVSDPRDAIECWRDSDGFAHYATYNVTTSLDAALALAERVLPGQEYEITTLYNVARVTLNINHGGEVGPFYGSNDCCNVPLAICASILRAKLIDTASNPR